MGAKVAHADVGRGECLVGLQNLGNTCFMNACLQCLLHTDALVDLFRQRLHEQRLCQKSPTRGALAEAFGELVRLVEASPAHSNVSPAQVSKYDMNRRPRFDPLTDYPPTLNLVCHGQKRPCRARKMESPKLTVFSGKWLLPR